MGKTLRLVCATAIALPLVSAFTLPVSAYEGMMPHGRHGAMKWTGKRGPLQSWMAGPTVGDYLTCVKGCKSLFAKPEEKGLLMQCMRGCIETRSPKGVVKSDKALMEKKKEMPAEEGRKTEDEAEQEGNE